MGHKGISRIDKVIYEWIQALCKGIDPPPQGKNVTVAASTAMVKGCRAGRFREHHAKAAKAVKIIFDKSISDIVGGHGSVRLMLEKIAPESSPASTLVRDPHDRRFLDALLHVATCRRWESYHILLATEDHAFRADAERAVAAKNDGRIHIAPDMGKFEDLFACQAGSVEFGSQGRVLRAGRSARSAKIFGRRRPAARLAFWGAAASRIQSGSCRERGVRCPACGARPAPVWEPRRRRPPPLPHPACRMGAAIQAVRPAHSAPTLAS